MTEKYWASIDFTEDAVKTRISKTPKDIVAYISKNFSEWTQRFGQGESYNLCFVSGTVTTKSAQVRISCPFDPELQSKDPPTWLTRSDGEGIFIHFYMARPKGWEPVGGIEVCVNFSS